MARPRSYLATTNVMISSKAHRSDFILMNIGSRQSRSPAAHKYRVISHQASISKIYGPKRKNDEKNMCIMIVPWF